MTYVSSVAKKMANKAMRRFKRYVAPLMSVTPIDIEGIERMLEANECGDFKWFIDRHRQRPVVIHGTELALVRQRFSERYPEQFAWLLERTEACLNNKFTEFRSPFIDMSDKDGGIRWCEDIKSGVTWPREHYLKTPITLDSSKSDIKGVWELSRFQIGPNLAQMEALTGDLQTYRQKFMGLVDDWQRANPYAFGPNWNCSMEVAIRAINWLTAAEMFNHNQPLPTSFMKAIYTSLFQHGRHIYENQEFIARGLNTNHYLANLIGLLALGTLFKPLTEAAEWLKHSVSELAEEIEQQTTADGFCFESSSAYHLLTFEFYLFALTVCRQNEIALPLKFIRQLKQVAAVTETLMAPHGRLVNMGDNDSGRLFKLANRDDCDPGWLALWATLEGIRAQRKPQSFSQTAESMWLFGHKEAHFVSSDNLAKPQQKPLRSKYLRDSGQVIMGTDDLWMHVNIAAPGTGGLGSHKHNDELAVSVIWKDHVLCADPGMSCYTRDEGERNRLRSVNMHSTVSINCEETNRFINGYLFALRSDGSPRVTSWLATQECDLLQAEHDCYTRLPGAPIVSRTIYFDKVARFWLVRDQIKCERVTLGSNNLQMTTSLIMPDREIRKTDTAVMFDCSLEKEESVSVKQFSNNATIIVTDCETAPAYGVSVDAKKIAFETRPGVTDLIWGIFPNVGNQRKERDISLLREKFRLLEWPMFGLAVTPAHDTFTNQPRTQTGVERQ